MPQQNSHLSDADLLSFADDELPRRRHLLVQNHLATCSTCQSRAAELDRVAANFIQSYLSTFDRPATLADSTAAARLRVRLAQSAPPPRTFWRWAALLPILAGALFLTLKTSHQLRSSFELNIVPNPQLTPGETSPLPKSQVCQASQQQQIPESLKQAVLAEYGVNSASNAAYEVDFLITPELGGAASIRNLWPQPYFNRPWNAHVKDALEDRLHQLVCNGDLDLSTAQHEIATNWVAAYKKYVSPNTPM